MLRDQWNANPDREPRDRDRRRGRGSNRDRGRNSYRERGRHSRPSDRHFDHPGRSPPARASRFGPDSSHPPGDSALDRSPPRGSSGPSPGFHDSRRPDQPRPPPTSDWNVQSAGSLDRNGPAFRRDESPFAPPFKRKRTRSPSPRGQRGPFPPHRPSFAKHGERRDRSPSYKNRGWFPGRGAPRRRSPRRGRDRRGKDRRRPDLPRLDRSRTPVRDRGFNPSPDRRSRTPSDEYSDRDSRHRSRSPSRHSVRSVNSKMSAVSSHLRGHEAMNSARPIQSIAVDSGRSPSPPRPIPSFDSSHIGGPDDGPGSLRDAFPIHGMRASDMSNKSRRRPSRPHLDTRSYSTSPRFASPKGSHHGSSQPASPYSGGREGWPGQPSYSGPG